uniref:LRRCT domain-containing protein n=1 Tax=Panagrellus redivivus TaxID=6233 RepID=A0A7E4W1F3_PANRE
MSNFTGLKSLSLGHNLLRNKSAVVLNNIPNLIDLNLAGNGFSTLDAFNLTDVPVKNLNLSHNHLSSTLDFTNFTSLTELNLDDNQLTTLPIFPETLEKLNLNNNKLEGDLIFPENNLTEVQLNGNKVTSKNEDAFNKIRKDSDTLESTTVSVSNVTELPPGMHWINFQVFPTFMVVYGP